MNPNNRFTLKAFVFFLFTQFAVAQNDVHLQMEDGSPFTVFVNDSVVNTTAQTGVSMHGLTTDTLRIKVGFDDGQRYGVTLFLLDKGKKTAGKEFTYLLRRAGRRVVPLFMGMRTS